MKHTFLFIIIVLGGAATVLWYIFVYAQSTTTKIVYNKEVTVVGIESCAPEIIHREESECFPAIKDDLGKYFIDNTNGGKSKILFSNAIRIKAILIKPDDDTLHTYAVDGILVRSLPKPTPINQ